MDDSEELVDRLDRVDFTDDAEESRWRRMGAAPEPMMMETLGEGGMLLGFPKPLEVAECDVFVDAAGEYGPAAGLRPEPAAALTAA